MAEAIPVRAQAEATELSVAGVSWAAVFAGAAASLSITLVMMSFGVGMGFAVVSPWGNSGVSATTFKIGTGLFFIVMAMLSSSIGGYLAGRLRTKWVGVHSTEVQFRDTAHGFLAWAVASVLGAVLLASPASSLIGDAVGGATQAAATSTTSGPMEGYVDTLLRPNDPSAQGQQLRPPPRDASPADLRLPSRKRRQPDRQDLRCQGRRRPDGPEPGRRRKARQRRRDPGQGRPRRRPQGGDADRDLADPVAVHRRVLGDARGHGRRRTSRRHLGEETSPPSLKPHSPETEERIMPILLWLVGIPIPLIILILLLR